MATHYLITNRHISKLGDKNFVAVNDTEFLRIDGDEEAGQSLRYGTVTFDPKKAKKLKDYKILLSPDPSPEALEEYAYTGAVPKATIPGSRKLFGALYSTGLKAGKVNKREDILFFIHGFNTDLESVMDTLKELHEKYVEPKESTIKHIVMFTWPAKRNVLRYRDDAQDAIQSGYALSRSFAELRNYFVELSRDKDIEWCNQKIHLMCHSMGGRVLEAMLQNLATLNIELNTFFTEVALMAADVDYDVLERPKPLYRLIDMCARIHIYYHNGDQALGISERTKNTTSRLGRWGSKNTIGLADDVYHADVTDIQDIKGIKNKAINHWYYYNSPSVVRDVLEVFQGEESVFTL